MKFFKYITIATAVSLIATTCFAQVKLVQKNKPKSRIVVTTTDVQDSIAASVLQDFVQRATKAQLPIIPADQVKKLKKGDVLIGNGLTNTSFVSDKLKEDGYLMTTEDGFLRIVSGGDGGSVSGVTALLEKYLGVYYWGFEEYSLNKTDELIIPKINIIDNPAFIHRQTHFYGQADPLYNIFNHYEFVNELFASGLWVHTFRRLVHPDKYGTTHPEYYAEIDGKRCTGMQLCLSNPEVLEIVTHQLDSIFKANPSCNMISVSQNDGNDSYCRCEKCQQLMDKEGISGPYINFVNKLAARFPNKNISTLSYLFTVVPPLNIKPLPNVNIMLCNINCTREVPLDQNSSGQRFMKSLEKWSSLTKNIFLWDYGINFHNYLAPFPNFHVLGKNMQLFLKNNVNTYFHQMSPSRGEDMAELRTWLVSKLMWNPYQDTDELIKTFLNGYYGKKAAPFIYQYIKMMEGGLIAGNRTLWIYDSPVSFSTNFLNTNLRKHYNELFDKAEKAAKNDSTYLRRIRRSRLSLLFADLENGKVTPGYDVEDLRSKLDRFERDCNEFEVVTLNEPGMKTKNYIPLYRNRFLKKRPKSLSQGAKITYLVKPSPRYTNMAQTAMTDGILGTNTFNNNWIGWEGTDGSYVIDLGSEKEISAIELDCLLAYNDWIWPIKNVSFAISTDNVNFKEIGKETLKKEDVKAPYYQIYHQLNGEKSARYIRINVEGQKFMPGSGNPCWFFIDETMIY